MRTYKQQKRAAINRNISETLADIETGNQRNKPSIVEPVDDLLRRIAPLLQVASSSAASAVNETTASRAVKHSEPISGQHDRKRPRLLTDFFPTIHQSSTLLPVAGLSSSSSSIAAAGGGRHNSANSSTVSKKQQLYLTTAADRVRQCPECGMSFIAHIEADVQSHRQYHSFALDGIQITPTKQFPETKDGVYKASGTLPKQKLKDLLWLMDRDLGACALTQDQLDQSGIWVEIKHRRIIGAVICQLLDPKQTEIFRFSNDCDSSRNDDSRDISEKVLGDFLCGINRIWVSPRWRRQGVASRLLASVCREFIYGTMLLPSQLAFSQPTQLGIGLASAFTGTKNFLAYRDI